MRRGETLVAFNRMDMAASLLLAIALMLIIEGMFPFVFPNSWRDTFRRIAQRPPHQIRIGGLIAMVLGVILLIIAT
jgi:uncharacterized protein